LFVKSWGIAVHKTLPGFTIHKTQNPGGKSGSQDIAERHSASFITVRRQWARGKHGGQDKEWLGSWATIQPLD